MTPTGDNYRTADPMPGSSMTFFHPDYTVGPGVSPDLPGTIAGLAGSTADRELPATGRLTLP